MHLPKIRVSAGFSLMEIIVSLVLISLMATGLFATSAHSRGTSRAAEEKLIALTLAEKKLAELREMGAKAIAVDPVTLEGIEVDQVPGILNGAFIRTQAKQPGLDNGEKEVLITVGWRDRLDQVRSESLTALIYES